MTHEQLLQAVIDAFAAHDLQELQANAIKAYVDYHTRELGIDRPCVHVPMPFDPDTRRAVLDHIRWRFRITAVEVQI